MVGGVLDAGAEPGGYSWPKQVIVTQRFQNRHRSEFGANGEGGEWLGSDGMPKVHVILLEDLPVGLGS
jgi:hypothetical protein